MKGRSRINIVLRLVAATGYATMTAGALFAQAANSDEVVRKVDAAVQSRVENVLGFTDIEHYAVYRGDDQTHPDAEMTVRDTYTKGKGKTYTILKQSGSAIVLHYGLHPLLKDEEDINEPGQVDTSWFTSANYNMTLQSGGMQQMNGRECYALKITPKHKATNLIDGTLWVDARDGSIVKVKGIASKKPSIWAGTTHMTRDYVNIKGYPMATHARAESDSFFLGRLVVTIDYSDYQLQIRPQR